MMKCGGEMGRVKLPNFAHYSDCFDNLKFRLCEVCKDRINWSKHNWPNNQRVIFWKQQVNGIAVSVSVSRLSVKRCTAEDLPKFTVSWSGLPVAHPSWVDHKTAHYSTSTTPHFQFRPSAFPIRFGPIMSCNFSIWP